jgi:putative phosphoribosyl transferase
VRFSRYRSGNEPAARIQVKLRHTIISIAADHVWLDGELAHAPDVRGLAALLRPSGSDPAKSREQEIATALHHAGFATLLINLLTTHEEARDPDARYNVPQMANRLVAIVDWIGHQPPLTGLSVGLVASDTASGAAVRAAWKLPDRFAAIVCRGGRPDLAGVTPLQALTVPLRIVAGSEDPHVPMLLQAYELVRAPRDWHTIEGSGESFATPGALDRFAQLAAEWLELKLPPPKVAETTAPPPDEAATSAPAASD